MMDEASAREEAIRIRNYFETMYSIVHVPPDRKGLRRIEADIGLRLPAVLRELYKLCDGLAREYMPPYVAPLYGESFSVAELTDSFRKVAPAGESENYICFSEGDIWQMLAINESPDGRVKIVRYDPECDRELNLVGSSLYLALMAREQWAFDFHGDPCDIWRGKMDFPPEITSELEKAGLRNWVA